MARFDYRTLTASERDGLVRDLLDVLLSLKSRDGMEEFLLHLLSPSEAVMIGRRWRIASRLVEGDTYREIAAEEKAGLSTVIAVDEWLSRTLGEYKERVAAEKHRIAKMKRREVRQEFQDMIGTPWDMLHRYPSHFALVVLLLQASQELRKESQTEET